MSAPLRRTFYDFLPDIPTATFVRLVYDKRIKSHGAKVLWICLFKWRNHTTGQCWPAKHTLKDEVGCSIYSLQDWTAELEQAGWLRVDRSQACERDGGKRFVYTMLDGKGRKLPVSQHEQKEGQI